MTTVTGEPAGSGGTDSASTAGHQHNSVPVGHGIGHNFPIRCFVRTTDYDRRDEKKMIFASATLPSSTGLHCRNPDFPAYRPLTPTAGQYNHSPETRLLNFAQDSTCT